MDPPTNSQCGPNVDAVAPRPYRLLKGILIGCLLVGAFGMLGTAAVVCTFIFPPRQEIERIPSPDGKLELVVTEYDHGALGGEVVVSVERKGFSMWSRELATAAWGDRPVVWWVTNETAFAGEGEMNVFTGPVQDLRGPSAHALPPGSYRGVWLSDVSSSPREPDIAFQLTPEPLNDAETPIWAASASDQAVILIDGRAVGAGELIEYLQGGMVPADVTATDGGVISRIEIVTVH
jgi:hypothetical protein